MIAALPDHLNWRFLLMPFFWVALNSEGNLSPAFIYGQGNSVHALQLLF
jgi:hypothetical protein